MTVAIHRRDVPEIEVLRAARDRPEWEPGQVWNLELALAQYPPKVVDARLDQLFDKGYLEYGVSLRTAWLTENGKQRLRELEAESGNPR